MDRHFMRCSYCERPLSVNVETREELKIILAQACPLCNEKALRYMGQVRKTNIVKTGVKAACDRRCTDSVGPSCNCKCNCLNHGTGKLVIFSKIVGKLSVVNAEMLNNNEIHIQRIKRMAEVKNKIKVNVIAFLNFKYKNVLEKLSITKFWDLTNEDYYKHVAYKGFLQKIDKIEDLKSIQKKINSLTKLIPQIGKNLEYLEAIFDKKQEIKV